MILVQISQMDNHQEKKKKVEEREKMEGRHTLFNVKEELQKKFWQETRWMMIL